MDDEIVREVRSANEAAIMLFTLLTSDADFDAIKLIISDQAYTKQVTTMAIATIGVSAIKTLAQLVDCDPLEIVQIAGVSAAEFVMKLEGLE